MSKNFPCFSRMYNRNVIFFYYGENSFAVDQQSNQQISDFTRQYGPDSLAKIDASETDTTNFVSQIVNTSLLSPRRIIILRDSDKVKSIWNSLGENLGRVPDEIDLVVIAESPDKRTKTFKDLLKTAKSKEFKPLREYELINWLKSEVSKLGQTITDGAARQLLTATSADQWRLSNEITKLSALNRPIDEQLVNQMVEPDLATNAFAVLEMSISGKVSQATNEVEKLRQIEDPNKFFGLLTSQVFALAAAVFGNSDTAKELKIHPFQLTKSNDILYKIGNIQEQKTRVKQIARVMAETDAKIKLSNADQSWTLIEAVLNKI